MQKMIDVTKLQLFDALPEVNQLMGENLKLKKLNKELINGMILLIGAVVVVILISETMKQQNIENETTKQ